MPHAETTTVIKQSHLRSLSELPPRPTSVELLEKLGADLKSVRKDISPFMENRKIDWITILAQLPDTFTCRDLMPFSKDVLKAARDCQLLYRMGMVEKKKVGKVNYYTQTRRFPQHAIDYHKYLKEKAGAT